MTPKGVRQFFTALVVSDEFRQKALPQETRNQAITDGYLGKPFDINQTEKLNLVSIPTVYSEEDLAKRYYKLIGKEF